MPERIEILSNHINSPVVWISSRKFPGIVWSGDSLKILHGLLLDLHGVIEDGDFPIEAMEILQEIQNMVEERIFIYESVIKDRDLNLPY